MTEPQTSARPQPYAVTEPATAGGVGTAALAVGLAVVGIGVVVQVMSVFTASIMYGAGLSAAQVGMVYSGISILSGLLGLVALILGVVGVQPARSRRLHAAAGLALGGAAVVSTLVGLLTSLIAWVAF